MRRQPSAHRHRRSARCALVLLASTPGCVWFSVGPPPEPTLEQPHVDARIDAALGDAIEESLPAVSYESQNPAMTDPLGRADPSLILREVETIHGEGRIVCRKQGRNVFGRCVFPPVPSPGQKE
jgi:hypothetical protein